jgi:phosphoadenosine phosphosulfate reductase
MERDIEKLNEKYRLLTPLQRVEELYNDFEKVLFTSSFGTTSALLLHLFGTVRPSQEVHFLDTTYHFPETLAYKETLVKLLGLKVIDVKPDEWRNQFTKTDHTWTKDPDLCCSVNKVEPLEKLKPAYEVWVSGLMAAQNEHRKQLDVFEEKGGILKFYPVIDMKPEEVEKYIAKHGLPQHPLKEQGFDSVGCSHCTAKGKGREGRWVDRSKTECGLHL